MSAIVQTTLGEVFFTLLSFVMEHRRELVPAVWFIDF